jgi:nicotinamidase-related amidase
MSARTFWLIVVSFASMTHGQTSQPAASQPATSQPAVVAPEPTNKIMHVRPRYVRLGVDEGQELAERNYHHAWLDWDVQLDRCALVLVDVWNWHYSVDTLERVDAISRNQIASLLAACRENGMQVIHAPAWPVATRQPNWVNMLEGVEPRTQYPDSPQWPPADFRAKRGEYAQFARPSEAHHEYNNYHTQNLRDFHEACRPLPTEPVILNGEELHRLCAERGIVHLFYVGFNTNACIIYRDYGIKDMIERGYHGILVRDATTGMETAETHDTMACTEGIIATLEQFGAYTVATDELIESMSQAEQPE